MRRKHLFSVVFVLCCCSLFLLTEAGCGIPDPNINNPPPVPVTEATLNLVLPTQAPADIYIYKRGDILDYKVKDISQVTPVAVLKNVVGTATQKLDGNNFYNVISRLQEQKKVTAEELRKGVEVDLYPGQTKQVEISLRWAVDLRGVKCVPVNEPQFREEFELKMRFAPETNKMLVEGFTAGRSNTYFIENDRLFRDDLPAPQQISISFQETIEKIVILETFDRGDGKGSYKTEYHCQR